MKEKILAFLVLRLQGVPKAYLDGVAENMSKTITEESQIETTINDGVIEALKYSASYSQTEGDRRATDATQTAVSNYEQKHNLKEGKPVIPGGGTQPNPKPEEDVPAWAQTILDDNKTLKEQLANIDSDKVSSNRKSKLSEAIAKAPEHYRTRIEKDFGRMSFDKDEDFDGWLGEITTEVTTLAEQAEASGSVFKAPLSGSQPTGEASPEEAGDIVSKM